MTRQSSTCAALVLLAIVSFGLPVALGQGEEEPAAGVPASKCPEANAVFEDAGVPVPDQYIPDCPDKTTVGEELANTWQDTTKADAVMDALKAGKIEEGQDPFTYPEALQDELELDADAKEGLAMPLDEQMAHLEQLRDQRSGE